MAKRKKQRKIKISLLIIVIILLFSVTVFGRYIYNNIRETYLISKQFYFSSDKLTTNGAKYTYNNWGGASSYKIEIELQSYINKLTKLDYDLGYTITCSTPDTDKIRLRYKLTSRKCRNNGKWSNSSINKYK